MKFLVTLLLITVSVGQLLARRPFTAEGEKMFKERVMSCVAKEGATESDVATMMAYHAPTTKTGQCLQACMMEMSGVVRIKQIRIQ